MLKSQTELMEISAEHSLNTRKYCFLLLPSHTSERHKKMNETRHHSNKMLISHIDNCIEKINIKDTERMRIKY